MDGRSASEKEGRFCKIKKVVSCSSDGLKRHKVLVVLDQVRREGEDETDYSLSVCLWLLLLNFLPASFYLSSLSRSWFNFLPFSFPSAVSGVSGAYTVLPVPVSATAAPPPHRVPAARKERGSAKVTISNTRKGHLLIFLPLSTLRVRPLSLSLSPPSVFIPLFQFSVNLFQSPLPP